MRLKRLAVPWAPEKKKHRFVVAPRGPYPLEECVPLAVVLRDMLGYADSYREAKRAIKSGAVSVCGRVRKDHRFAVGLLDVVEVAGQEFYRLVPSRKGFKLVGIKKSEANKKISKVTDKRVVKGGRIQLNLSDGRNILTDDREIRTQDSLLITLPDQGVKEVIKLEKGAVVMCLSGSRRGELGVVKSRDGKDLVISGDSGEYEQKVENVIAIGTKKPAVTVS